MSADNWTVCPRCPDEGNQFREDWEIGLDGADLFIDYRGCCRVCNLRVAFCHDAPVDLTGGAA